ncbi:MAG: methylmalonyl-CoA epimerase [Acetobacteraceae bacterium]|nr:methylmalonyl-CoA epimerase [Acetobacteraceae bacterium]
MKIKRVEHIAVVVKDMAQTGAMLENIFGLKMEYEEQIKSTKLAMFPVGETYIELLQAAAPDSQVAQVLAEKGEGYYHICFEVDDIDGAVAELKAKSVKLLNDVPREGHGGSRIVFINPESTGNFLIELAELALGH